MNLEPETVVRLAEAAPNIQAIKESSGKLPQIAELVRSLPRGFKVFSGDDNLALASIGVGAHGLISVASNEIPAEMSRMIHAALRGNWSEARELERRYARLIDANFWDSNPGPVKTVLALMGRCADHVRLPLVPPPAAVPRPPGAAGRRTRPAQAPASAGGAGGSLLKEGNREQEIVTDGQRPPVVQQRSNVESGDVDNPWIVHIAAEFLFRKRRATLPRKPVFGPLGT